MVEGRSFTATDETEGERGIKPSRLYLPLTLSSALVSVCLSVSGGIFQDAEVNFVVHPNMVNSRV